MIEKMLIYLMFLICIVLTVVVGVVVIVVLAGCFGFISNNLSDAFYGWKVKRRKYIPLKFIDDCLHEKYCFYDDKKFNDINNFLNEVFKRWEDKNE